MEENIRVEALSKCYPRAKGSVNLWSAFFRKPDKDKGLWALRDLSFTAKPGEALGIIGRNGAGKTTLLKVLAGITAPTSGRAILKGEVRTLLEIGSGLQRDLSGRENIYWNAALYGIPKSRLSKVLDQIVSFAELERFIDMPVRHYSSGMFMRLAFSVAINMEPDILLADEVLAVGDAAFQNRCLERMSQIGETGITVLFVSHDMSAIRRMCSRALWLDQGQAVFLGDAEEAIKKYESSVAEGQTARKKLAETLPASRLVEIVSAELVSDAGEPIGAVNRNSDFNLKIVLRSHDDDFLLNILFDVFTGGVQVLRAGYPELYPVTKKTDTEFWARFPRRFFSDREYSVNLLIQGIKDGKKFPAVLADAVRIRVFDPEAKASEISVLNYHRSAVVNPDLSWSHAEIKAVAR
jgi:ABC-type polysaccharide/polyol phosphate transport system ATPase subunit